MSKQAQPLFLIVFHSIARNYLWIFVSFIILTIYLPLLIKGGIICDDWGDILASFNCNSFFQCYGNWFPLFSNRPLAPLPITVTTRLFATNYSLYLLTNTLIYFSAIAITAISFSPFLSRLSRQIFFLLAAVPFIAMPVIISPINQLTATVAFLYWAISLKALLRYSQDGNRFTYFSAYFFLLCGFLTYEIILPLLFFTAFLPILNLASEIHKKNKSSKTWYEYFLEFILPIFGVLLIVILWQKVVAPHFIEVFSRLNFNPSNLTKILFTWVHLFLAQIPNLFVNALPHITFGILGILALLATYFLASTYQKSRQVHNKTSLMEKKYLSIFLISAASFLSSSLIFLLTDESAVSWGYQARGLSSTLFTLSILVACLTQIFLSYSRKIIGILFITLIYIFTSFSVLSFSIQRDKYIESWNLQLHILQDAISLINAQRIGPNASILANVPRYTPNNYNRELVYSQSWDFPAALMLNTKDQVSGGIVIDSRGKDLQNLRIKGDIAMVNDQGKVDFNNLWLYDFEPATKQGSLIRLKNSDELQSLITNWNK